MKKSFLAAAILLSTTLVLAGCQEQNPAASALTAKVGTWKTAQTIQPFYYQDFLPENSTVEVLPFTNPGDQKTALLAGELDLCGTTLVTAIMAAAQGEPVKVVASLAEKCSALVVGKDSGIQRPEDLKGKTIAYVPGTMHHILLLETLEKAGLNPATDVQLKRIDFFDMGQALAQGEIDAFCSGEPFPSAAVREGYGRILLYPYYDESVGYINGAMLTTQAKIAQEPEKIQALVSAHRKATEYLKENPEAWLTRAAEFGTPPEVLAIAADNMVLAWDITPEMISQTKALAQRMQKLGLIAKVPDIDALFDTRFTAAPSNDGTSE